MGKVLIISTPFFGYQNSVARAFKSYGFETQIDTYELPVNPFKGRNKWEHKFCRDREAFEQKNYALYNAYIKPVFDSCRPDIVFIYDGSILLDETLDYFRKSAKVIIWMYDSVQNPRFSRCLTHIDHCDAFFCFEQKDVELYERMGRKAFFLPLACDTFVYHSLPGTAKDIDIFFAGAIYSSVRRKKALEAIADRYADRELLFYGKYKPFEKGPLQCLFRGGRDVFMNKNIPPVAVNEMLNRSRIAINIHHEQTMSGANQRVFEVCGAGTYQICDTNPYLERLFPSGEVGLFHNEEEMFSMIDYALSHDMSSQAAAAQRIVLGGHTFEARVGEMLKHV